MKDERIMKRCDKEWNKKWKYPKQNENKIAKKEKPSRKKNKKRWLVKEGKSKDSKCLELTIYWKLDDEV